MNTTKSIQPPAASRNCLHGSKQDSFGTWFFKKKKKKTQVSEVQGKDDKILIQTAKAAIVWCFSFPLRSCRASTECELFFRLNLMFSSQSLKYYSCFQQVACSSHSSLARVPPQATMVSFRPILEILNREMKNQSMNYINKHKNKRKGLLEDGGKIENKYAVSSSPRTNDFVGPSHSSMKV